MKISRVTVATVAASALLLSGCSGDGQTSGSTATTGVAGGSGAAADDVSASSTGLSDSSVTTTATAPVDTSAATTDGGDAAAASSGPSDDASVTTAPGDQASATQMVDPTEAATAGALTLDQATAVATQLLGSAEEVKGLDGAKARTLIGETYASNAARAAQAADRLEKVTGKPAVQDPVANPVRPNVLAISRKDSGPSAMILVQTVPPTGMPELHLLVSGTGKPRDFRIYWSAPMLPGTQIPPFNPRSEGTPVVRRSTGGLAKSPGQAISMLATYVNYPATVATLPKIQTNGYAPAVRQAAAAQAAAVQAQATLREMNVARPRSTRTLTFQDGSGLVMSVMDRSTAFYVRSNAVLSPPEIFRVFHGDTELKRRAVLRTKVFVAVHVPKKGDPATPDLVAVREQVVDADGH